MKYLKTQLVGLKTNKNRIADTHCHIEFILLKVHFHASTISWSVFLTMLCVSNSLVFPARIAQGDHQCMKLKCRPNKEVRLLYLT